MNHMTRVSTVLRPARDMSATRPDSSTPETTLVHAYRNALVDEPCACGGVVRASAEDPGPGVREHQETDRHLAWRARERL